MSDFNVAIQVVLTHEGGWVSNPNDPGGETNFGWSMMNIQRIGLTPDDLGVPNFDPGCLKSMTVDTAIALYKKYYWDPGGYEAILDQTSATKIFDCGINCGPAHAHQMAQRAATACGRQVTADGVLGPMSIAAINTIFAPDFVRAMGAQMEAYYRALVAAKPSDAEFLSNWLKRAAWGVTAST